MNFQSIDASVSTNEAVKKIVLLPEIPNTVRGKCIFSKGVFDLLHYGHLSLFYYLKELKNKHKYSIVVGVTSDAVVKMKKGPKRPINPEKERLLQIALLPQIDFLYLHDEPGYSSAISILQPKFYIKGMDTAGAARNQEELMQANPEFGFMTTESEVVIFSDDGSISSSTIIKRINS